MECLAAILLGVALTPVLHVLARRWSLYGRERVGVSMLLALCLRPLLSLPLFLGFVPEFWLGWVIPGLVAADMQRQGIGITAAGIVSVTVAASFASSILFELRAFFR
jgi:hypothetical protein